MTETMLLDVDPEMVGISVTISKLLNECGPHAGAWRHTTELT